MTVVLNGRVVQSVGVLGCVGFENTSSNPVECTKTNCANATPFIHMEPI